MNGKFPHVSDELLCELTKQLVTAAAWSSLRSGERVRGSLSSDYWRRQDAPSLCGYEFCIFSCRPIQTSRSSHYLIAVVQCYHPGKHSGVWSVTCRDHCVRDNAVDG